jgi:TPR repeat protein
MSRALVCALVVAGLAVPRHARAAPVCTDVADCERACHDGSGLATACTRRALQLTQGQGNATPDHARAAKLYEAACAGKDADACLALAELVRTGWLFEVDKDLERHRTLVDRALAAGLGACTIKGTGDTSGCWAAARAAEVRAGLRADADKDVKAVAATMSRFAEAGCKGHDLRACQLLIDHAYAWVEAKAIDDAERARLEALVKAARDDACYKDADGAACYAVAERSRSDIDVARLTAAVERGCAAHDVTACVVRAVTVVADAQEGTDTGKVKKAVADLITTCDGDGHPLCTELAGAIVTGLVELELAPDPRRGLAILSRRCSAGDRDACAAASKLYAPGGPGAVQDPAQVVALGERACMLTSPDERCEVCDDFPNTGECQRRLAFVEHAACYAGKAGLCELVATKFRDGTGVAQDHAAAARHFRRGCDGAQKAACAALDELCIADGSFDRELCHQSLIHTDLFYEAEWQFRTTGSASIIGAPGGGDKNPTAPVTLGAAVSAAGNFELKRGHLDADLVVNIVLDRARQAAIRLVVDELTAAGVDAKSRYLNDLLTQGSRLLADPTTLRREKFTDLAMTVVRAFVASNLVDTIYPNGAALFAAPEIGPTIKAHAAEFGVIATGPISGELHGYLVDAAYNVLAATHLFARTEGGPPEAPDCRFTGAGGKALCKLLADPAVVEKALHVERILDGLRLAKALREVGTLDVRRFIEALSRSRSIANLGQTPGLVLSQWRADLVVGVRDRLSETRAQLSDLALLLRASTYSDKGPELSALAARATSVKKLLDGPTAAIVLGSDAVERVRKILTMIQKASQVGLQAPTGPAPIAPPGTPGAPPVIAPPDPLDDLRKQLRDELAAWGMRNSTELFERIGALEDSAKTVRDAIDRLERAIFTIEATMKRFHGQRDRGELGTLDLGDVPLDAVGDLAAAYKEALGGLKDLHDGLRAIYPGADASQIDFALSATARLLGFFDMMERLARATRISQTCADVVAAIQLLGSTRDGEFVAPLYDVLDPVLDAIKTHEPMTVDLLFGVIARVRLDTLVSSLQGGGNACKDDRSVDCWTVKVVHALQESVEYDGTSIRVDGGKFAARLASHGDDFRRKHKWRSYFHLTVGVGALSSHASDTAPVGGAEARRSVPVIAEQIGFGWASPAVWKGRLTFKFAAAASGLLYRAVLDSKESKAIMLHPAFVAVDVYDLVELYVSPATILVYPPDNGANAQIRWGISAGLSVPLSAYLERL